MKKEVIVQLIAEGAQPTECMTFPSIKCLHEACEIIHAKISYSKLQKRCALIVDGQMCEFPLKEKLVLRICEVK